MKKLFSLIMLFLKTYEQSLLENKETSCERIDRTCGTDFYF